VIWLKKKGGGEGKGVMRGAARAGKAARQRTKWMGKLTLLSERILLFALNTFQTAETNKTKFNRAPRFFEVRDFFQYRNKR
jgi:hypothetical protein